MFRIGTDKGDNTSEKSAPYKAWNGQYAVEVAAGGASSKYIPEI